MASRRRCKNEECREWFIPKFDNQWWCSADCGVKLALDGRRRAREKAEKAADKKRRREEQQQKDKLRIRKLAVKPLSYFAKQAQKEFNAFIRERDVELPCISCGRFHDGQYHAGHYRTVGANPELRFSEDNCHRQCAPCNNHLSGNIENYTPAIREKIGERAYQLLMGAHEPQRYRREDFERIRDEYKAKRKVLKQQKEAA